MGRTAERLDGFTDAAFAFALTLLVIGGAQAPATYGQLAGAVAEVPAFAIGFAIIAMFWFAHVRWRGFRGEGDWLSVLLSLLLVFLVLVYVQPLRAMARSFSTFLGGGGTPFRGDLGDLFLVYGAGFAAMAAATAALFVEALRNPALDPARRAAVRGEAIIWIILVATGLLSSLLAAFDATERIAPALYATLPLSIGLFTWRYAWDGDGPPTEDAVAPDARRVAPHVARNADPIIAVLSELLPERGLVLEVASGTGEHAARFARAFPGLAWQPSDPDPESRESIAAWRADSALANLRAPIRLDVCDPVWPIDRADALLCINMIHISPWLATLSLLRGAGAILAPQAPLYLYGPFRQAGVPTAPSNAAFDLSLRARDPSWGLRDLEAVVALAEEQRLDLERVVPMPANNLSVVFRRR